MKISNITSVAQNPKNPSSVRLNLAGSKHLWVNEVVINPTLGLDRINLGTFNDLCAMGGYQLETPSDIVAHKAGDAWTNETTGETGEYAKDGFHVALKEGEYLGISATANPTAMGLKFQLPQNRVGVPVSQGNFNTPTDSPAKEQDDEFEDVE